MTVRKDAGSKSRADRRASLSLDNAEKLTGVDAPAGEQVAAPSHGSRVSAPVHPLGAWLRAALSAFDGRLAPGDRREMDDEVRGRLVLRRNGPTSAHNLAEDDPAGTARLEEAG